MRVWAQVLDIFVRWHARVGTETMGGLWGDAPKHVWTVGHVGRNGAGRKGAVREMGVVLEATHTILERLEGGRRVTSTIAHTIFIGEIRVVASAVDAGDAALREVGVMAVGKAFLVAIERENRRVLYAGHGVAWGEWGNLAGTATVGGRDAAHHVVRAAVGVGKCGNRV